MSREGKNPFFPARYIQELPWHLPFVGAKIMSAMKLHECSLNEYEYMNDAWVWRTVTF